MTVDQQRAPLASLRFHTADLPDEARFDAWRQRVAGLYDVLPSAEAGLAAFRMDTTSWHLGQIIAGTADFGPREQVRTLRHIRADQVDHYRLTLLTAGTLQVDADGRRSRLQAGQMLLTDMSRPETTSIEAGSNISIFVPREILDEAMPRPADLHGVVPGGAVAGLLADHLRALARYLPGLTNEEAALLSHSAVQMIAAGVLPSAESTAAARRTVETTLLRQACRYVEMHLKDEDVGPQSLCAALQISRATLYRLFEPLGGVATYVKERRLVQIHERLVDPAERRYVARIAEDYGFRSAAHFSAAFRERYGYSPRDARSHAAQTVTAEAGATGADGSFDGWLRALR